VGVLQPFTTKGDLLTLVASHCCCYFAGQASDSLKNIKNISILTFVLLLKLNEELGIELDFVVYVFFTSRMLFSAKRRRMLKVYAAILAIKVRHVYYYRELLLILLIN